MLKDVVSWLDYSCFDVVAMVLLVASFFIILWGVWRLRPESVDQFSSIPIRDIVVDPKKGPSTS